MGFKQLAMFSRSLFCLIAVASAVRAQACPQFPVVDLGYAKHEPTVINRTSLHNISYATYANIRFAQPPVGDLRFRAPKTPPPTNLTVQNGVYPQNATDCLNSILPGLDIAPGLAGATWGSEDCLFLDVKVPEGVQGGKIPVLHWLFGGGYFFGSKNDWDGDPAGLFQDMASNEKFIVVTSNYRLSALGWMSAPGVDMTPNAGIWDALTALEWTKQYISYFGGDPDQITVIGESAGGGILQHLLTLRGGKGDIPFNQAILTSPGYRPHVNRSQDMTDIYQAFLKASNCTDITCLRKASTDVIASANRDLLFNAPTEGWVGPKIGYGPIIDEDIVPDLPDRLLEQGKYHTSVKKVLTADMVNDGKYVVSINPTNWSDFLSVWMKSPTADTVAKVAAMYPNTTGDAYDLFSKDVNFACHAYETAKAFGSDAYRYSMSIPPASHGQDQYYYFFTNSPNTLVESKDVARQMQAYIRRFILQGNMGGGECANGNVLATPQHWPSYSTLQRWMNITTDGFQVVTGEPDQAKRCEFVLSLIADLKNGF